MTWFGRVRRRRALLREAAALEAEARRARRSLASLVAGSYGVGWAGALMAAASYVDHLEHTRTAVLDIVSKGDEERAKELEQAARQKREEAGRL